MTKMIKKITFSVHIITGNSRGVWGSVVSETARIQRLVTLVGLPGRGKRFIDDSAIG